MLMGTPLHGEFVGNPREFTADGERFIIWADRFIPPAGSVSYIPVAYEMRTVLYDAHATRRDEWLFQTGLPRELQTAEDLSDGECLAIHRAWLESGGRGTGRR